MNSVHELCIVVIVCCTNLFNSRTFVNTKIFYSSFPFSSFCLFFLSCLPQPLLFDFSRFFHLSRLSLLFSYLSFFHLYLSFISGLPRCSLLFRLLLFLLSLFLVSFNSLFSFFSLQCLVCLPLLPLLFILFFFFLSSLFSLVSLN